MKIRSNKFVQEKDYTEDIEFCREAMTDAFDEVTISKQCTEYGEQMRLHYYKTAYEDSLNVLRYRYIQGDNLAAMHEDCEQVFTHLALLSKERQRIVDMDINDTSMCLIWNIGFFISVLTALDFPEARIVEFCQQVPISTDCRLECRLLQRYCPTYVLHDEFYSNATKKLFAIIEAEPAKRPGLIVKYLDRLAAEHEKNPYSLNHNAPMWDGYWDYAISGIVTAFNIDDSSFIDHEYYATDLMRLVAEKRGAPIVLPPLDVSPDANRLPAIPAKAPKRIKTPKLLQPFTELFDLMTSTLPATLQDMWFNALVKWLKTPDACDEDIDLADIGDFIWALDEAQQSLELAAIYKRQPLLYCDWKDIDSAEDYAISVAKSVGLDEYEPDQLAQAGIGTWYALQMFEQWLQARGYCLIMPLTGHDSHSGFILPCAARTEALSLLATFDLQIEGFVTEGVASDG